MGVALKGQSRQTEARAERQSQAERGPRSGRRGPGDTGPCGLWPWEPGRQLGRQEAAPGKREERCPGRGGDGLAGLT